MKYSAYALVFRVVSTATLAMTLATAARSQTETILYNFGSSSASELSDAAPLVLNGNLYGTTLNGGGSSFCGGCGTVFQLVPNGNGTWTYNVIYTFGATVVDAENPETGVVTDGKGNLYGTSVFGGNSFLGAVYELSPGSNGSWTETVLYSFTGGANGQTPADGVTLDSAGNIYGIGAAGTYGFGMVFKLVQGSNGTWTEQPLHNFAGDSDGSLPTGNLVVDKSGNVFGVTSQGGPHDYGVVFELSPASNGKWIEKIVHAFTGGPGGSFPSGGLTADAAGNLYGVAGFVAFELSPSSNGSWTFKSIHSFVGGGDGVSQNGAMALDKAGNLYGTTYLGGKHRGTVYELSPGSNGQWTEKILHTFLSNGVDGFFPGVPGLGLDSTGNVYGTTFQGGAYTWGVVYEVAP